jgi:formiminotetrahydrofolate cyclodeaminase
LFQAAGKEPEGPAREAAVQAALAAAIDVPRQITKLALAVMEDLKELLPKSNPYLVTDLLGGAVLAGAAVRLSDNNVRVNVPNVADQAVAAAVASSSAADVARADEIVEQLQREGFALLG